VEFDVLVEVPTGTRNKFVQDPETGRLRLDRMLFTSTRYPCDYGYIEGTLGGDGEPLDAMVLVEEPTFPGCLIRCRTIGMFQMKDEKGPDEKVLCIPTADVRQEHIQDMRHLPEFTRLEIQHFLATYKALEPGKTVVGADCWAHRDDAEKVIEASRERLRQASDGQANAHSG
jgi:inorganic pyrophosphatase